MEDNFINYQEKADKVFNWFEDRIFERERHDISRDEELIFKLSDFLEDEDNAGDVLEVSGLLADFKDVDDAAAATDKLINLMIAAINKEFPNL